LLLNKSSDKQSMWSLHWIKSFNIAAYMHSKSPHSSSFILLIQNIILIICFATRSPGGCLFHILLVKSLCSVVAAVIALSMTPKSRRDHHKAERVTAARTADRSEMSSPVVEGRDSMRRVAGGTSLIARSTSFDRRSTSGTQQLLFDDDDILDMETDEHFVWSLFRTLSLLTYWLTDLLTATSFHDVCEMGKTLASVVSTVSRRCCQCLRHSVESRMNSDKQEEILWTCSVCLRRQRSLYLNCTDQCDWRVSVYRRIYEWYKQPWETGSTSRQLSTKHQAVGLSFSKSTSHYRGAQIGITRLSGITRSKIS